MESDFELKVGDGSWIDGGDGFVELVNVRENVTVKGNKGFGSSEYYGGTLTVVCNSPLHHEVADAEDAPLTFRVKRKHRHRYIGDWPMGMRTTGWSLEVRHDPGCRCGQGGFKRMGGVSYCNANDFLTAHEDCATMLLLPKDQAGPVEVGADVHVCKECGEWYSDGLQFDYEVVRR